MGLAYFAWRACFGERVAGICSELSRLLFDPGQTSSIRFDLGGQCVEKVEGNWISSSDFGGRDSRGNDDKF
jgi:hypothetical protein